MVIDKNYHKTEYFGLTIRYLASTHSKIFLIMDNIEKRAISTYFVCDYDFLNI